MQIKINDDVRITSDRYNIIIEIRKIAKSGESAGDERWVADSFHGSIEQAVLHIHQQNIQLSDADSIDKLIAVIERSKNEIIDAVLERQRRKEAKQLDLFATGA